jgi:hypothetical protein
MSASCAEGSGSHTRNPMQGVAGSLALSCYACGRGDSQSGLSARNRSLSPRVPRNPSRPVKVREVSRRMFRTLYVPSRVVIVRS